MLIAWNTYINEAVTDTKKNWQKPRMRFCSQNRRIKEGSILHASLIKAFSTDSDIPSYHLTQCLENK